jgi:hypothetical protein
MIARYPAIAITPVSPSTPQVLDVTCSSCGMLHAAIGVESARDLAARHRDLHLVVTIAAATIATAAGMVMWYAARLLGLAPAAGAIVGATIGLVAAVRVLSPDRQTARRWREHGDA